MSSFYDDASWLLIPSGIKEDVVFAQKPTSGLGDLTFTRASDATYTDSTGVVRRSPYNLVTFSEMFSDVAWTKNFTSVSANTSIAPNGTLTADTISADGTANLHAIIHSISAVNGFVYTHSVYAKKGTNNFIQLIGGAAIYTSGLVFANFDLNNGVVGSVGAGTTATITNVGNGWYRCTMTATATATVTGSGLIVGLVTSATSTRGELNTLTTNVLLWGAQLVEGTSALDYFPTTDRQNVPRIDFRNADGTLSSCGRLLLEPQRTNSIRNSSMVGAVAGSPGTIPTNWTVSNAGLTQTIVGVGTELGLPYVDIRLNGTASGAIFNLFTEGPAQVVASNGQTWTNALYMKTVAAPNPYNSILNNFSERTAAGTLLTGAQQAMTLTSTLTRFSFTRTNTNVLTERINAGYQGTLTIGATYDFTIRIAAPQMELGAYATSWVPTTTAAVTRIADVANKTGISSLIGQTAGTIFADLSYIATSTASARWFNVFGTTQHIALASNGINQIRVITNALSDTLSTAPTSNTGIKIAFAYNNSGVVCFINGTQYTLTNGGGQVMTSLTSIAFDLSLATGVVEAKINQAALFPTRLTNEQLAQLTTL
jgi:hypothetical protein